jgi:hypothetical protein
MLCLHNICGVQRAYVAVRMRSLFEARSDELDDDEPEKAAQEPARKRHERAAGLYLPRIALNGRLRYACAHVNMNVGEPDLGIAADEGAPPEE